MGKVVSPVAGQFGIMALSAMQLAADGTTLDAVECQVIHEDVLTIEIEDVGSYALMWTPTQDNSQAVGYTIEDGVLAEGGIPEALALGAGFVFTEGIVSRLGDIASMSVCPERPDIVRMRLTSPGGIAVRRRNVIMNSSCGVCGGREQLAESMASPGKYLTPCAWLSPISNRYARRCAATRAFLAAPEARMVRRHSTPT